MADEQAKRDPNYVTTLLAVSNADQASTVRLWADPTTHRLLVDVNGALGTSSIDDAAFTAATDSGIPIMGFVTTDEVNSGDVGVVKMLANRQLAVTLFDSAGGELSVGGGTQYTEDAAAAANPVGTIHMLVRKDTPAGEVTTDGDNIAQRGTNYGAGYVTLLDSSGNEVSVGGGTQYTEDAAAAANPVGNMLMGVRADALAGKTTTDGDNVAASMTDKGELYVKHADAIAVTNAGLTELAAAINASSQVDVNLAANGIGIATSAKQDTIITSVQLIDDAIVADDAAFTPATTKVMMAGFEFDDASPDSVNEGDAGAARMSANRNIYTTIRDAAGNERGLNVAADGSIAVTIATVPSHAVTNAGTFVTQIDGNALTALQLIDDMIFADDAAVTLGTSKGSLAAGVAVNTDGTDPTAVSAEGDAAALRTDMNRLLLVNQTHPRFWHVSADYASAQTNTSVKAAPGASLYLYITDIVISNGATAGNITLLDGSGGTVLFEIYPAINGGATISLRNPIRLSANTALCITSTTVTTHSVFVSGYIAP